VQRKKVDFNSNERYRLQSSNAGKEIDNGVLKLFSIKVKRIKNQTRYEVGDSIFFKKNNKKDESPSIGRIKAMYHYDKIERIIEIELLELNNGVELMDGGDGIPHIKISEKDLMEHVVILSGKDFKELSTGWACEGSTSAFMQKKA